MGRAPAQGAAEGVFLRARHQGLLSFVENVDHFDLLPSRYLVLRKKPFRRPPRGGSSLGKVVNGKDVRDPFVPYPAGLSWALRGTH